jgi:hypothetical protein
MVVWMKYQGAYEINRQKNCDQQKKLFLVAFDRLSRKFNLLLFKFKWNLKFKSNIIFAKKNYRSISIRAKKNYFEVISVVFVVLGLRLSHLKIPAQAYMSRDENCGGGEGGGRKSLICTNLRDK